jgi:hypothetical protein
MMLPTKFTEDLTQNETTESSKTEFSAGEKSETTESESQSTDSDNQEEFKPGTHNYKLHEQQLIF